MTDFHMFLSFKRDYDTCILSTVHKISRKIFIHLCMPDNCQFNFILSSFNCLVSNEQSPLSCKGMRIFSVRNVKQIIIYHLLNVNNLISFNFIHLTKLLNALREQILKQIKVFIYRNIQSNRSMTLILCCFD